MNTPFPSSFPLRRYLNSALSLLRYASGVLWFLALVGLANALPSLFHGSSSSWPVTFLSIILTTCATPIFYGIFFHLIHGSYVSAITIAKTYLPGYLWLLVRMYVPAILLCSIPAMIFAEDGTGGYLEVGLIFFSMLYLFVIPFFYHTGRQQGAISKGIQFLIRHLSASTPLLLTVLLLEASLMLAQFNRVSETFHSTLLTALVDFIVFFGASLIDLVVFIMLLLVVRDSSPPQAPSATDG